MQDELKKIGKVFTTDILIIGAGLGGTVTATKVHELNESAKILMIEKGYYGYNGDSTKAGHGMVMMAPEDDLDTFCEEQVKMNQHGMYLNDQEYMVEYQKDGYTYVQELERLGGTFAHNEDGSLHYHKEFDGKLVSSVNLDLDFANGFSQKVLENGARVLERTYFTDLLTNKGKVVGAVAFNIDTLEFYIIRAKAVVMASADFSATAKDMFFSPATALYAAYEAGGQLRNVEQLLQYDLCLRNTGNYIYGMHWVVFNRLGENIFEKYGCTDFEDIGVDFIRGALKEVEMGNGPLYADYSKLPATSTTEGEGFNQGILMKKRVAMNKFIRSMSDGDVLGKPEVSLLARVATRPLRADIEGKTTVKNLWGVGFITMCGTAHGSWVHGDGVGNAGRTALRAAESIASEIDGIQLEDLDLDQVKKYKARIFDAFQYKGKELPYKVIHYLSRLACVPDNSLNKTEDTIDAVLKELANVREHLEETIHVPEGDGHHLYKAIEARRMVDMLEIMYMTYQARKESRGYHIRGDYTERNDAEFTKWICVDKGEDGRPIVSFERIPFEKYRWKPEVWAK